MNFWNSTSSMFGSNNSTNLYSLFSERASIKNGTYKRLLNSYFDTVGGSSDKTSSTRRSRGSDIIDKLLKEKMYPTVSKETKEANSNLTSGLNSLQSSVSALQKDSTYEDTENGTTAADKVVSAVKSYVTSYNDVVTASKSSTLSNKTAYVANMMSTTSKFSKELSEIGVSLKQDGTLQLDETKLKAADISKVQKLFSSDNIQSYGSTIASRVKFAGGGSSTSTNKTDNKTDTDTDTKKPVSTGAAGLKTDGEALASSDLFAKIKDKDGNETYNLASDALYQKVKDKDGNETDEYDVKKIFATAKSFVSNYNKMFDNAESSSNSGVISNLAYIRERTKNNSKALEEFGISVDKKGRMKLDEDTFKKADMSKVQDFFKDYGSYVASNASRVDYYMNTNANAANGYTSRASYNIPSISGFSETI